MATNTFGITRNDGFRLGADPGELAGLQNLQVNPSLQQDLQIPGATGLNTSIGQGFDFGGLAKGFGNIAGGIGGLAKAWQGMQGLKLAKNQLRTQNEQWQKNYDAQREDINFDRSQRARARARMET